MMDRIGDDGFVVDGRKLFFEYRYFFFLTYLFFFIVFIVANYHVTIPFVMLISMPSKFR